MGLVLIENRMAKLRELMGEKNIDYYIIPSSDAHQSEYIADYYNERQYISGFTGSSGLVIISMDKALLWTDGRYFIQAIEELKDTSYELMKIGIQGYPTFIEWLKENVKKNETIGFNGKIVSEKLYESIRDALEDLTVKIRVNDDLIGRIWENRPKFPTGSTFLLGKEYTGLDAVEKLDLVRKKMKANRAEYFLISSLDDIAWLYNIRGNDIANNPVFISYSLVTHDKAYLYVDNTKITREVRDYLRDNKVEIRDYEDIVEDIKNIDDNSKLLLDKSKVNRSIYREIKATAEVIDKRDISTDLKAIKNKTEIKNQKIAYRKDAVAISKFLYWLEKNIGKIEITEVMAQNKLEEFRRLDKSFLEPSFDTISAYGKNGAKMHYRADEKSYDILRSKGLYLVDSGGQYLEGTTDITRTLALGKISEEERKDFTLVLRGHIKLLNAKFLYGTTGHALDILARYELWQRGIDYKSGTGHGVGYCLNVHEGPQRIAPIVNDISLEKGMVVTVEPGVYREGKYGIRIENVAYVDEWLENESGKFMEFKLLSYIPIDINCIDKNILEEREIDWINNYHEKTYELISPYLKEDEKIWLKEKTKKI